MTLKLVEGVPHHKAEIINLLPTIAHAPTGLQQVHRLALNGAERVTGERKELASPQHPQQAYEALSDSYGVSSVAWGLLVVVAVNRRGQAKGAGGVIALSWNSNL